MALSDIFNIDEISLISQKKNRLIESDKLTCMAKKSRNNRRKTAGKFTDNPTQYMLLCNPDKYEHTYDKTTGFIIVKNIKQDRVVGVFDYPEPSKYLESTHILL